MAFDEFFICVFIIIIIVIFFIILNAFRSDSLPLENAQRRSLKGKGVSTPCTGYKHARDDVGAKDNMTVIRERQLSNNRYPGTDNSRPTRIAETTSSDDRLTDNTPVYTSINTGTTRTSIASRDPQTNTAGSRGREAVGTSPVSTAVIGSHPWIVDAPVNHAVLESVQSVENPHTRRPVTSVTNASCCTTPTVLVGPRRTVISSSTPANVGPSNVGSFLETSLPRVQIASTSRISTSATGLTGAKLIYGTDGLSAQTTRTAGAPSAIRAAATSTCREEAPSTSRAAAISTSRTAAPSTIRAATPSTSRAAAPSTSRAAAPSSRHVTPGIVARPTVRSTQDLTGAHKTYLLPDSWSVVRRRTCAARTSVNRSSRPLTPTPPPSPPTPKRRRTRLFELYIENSEPEDKKLDLRGLFLREAMATFFNFFVLMESMYSSNGFKEEDHYIYVVTGYGKLSAGKKPVIKPAVQDFLDKNDIRHNWLNDGLVMIDFCDEEDEESDTESEESDTESEENDTEDEVDCSEDEVDYSEDEEDFEYL